MLRWRLMVAAAILIPLIGLLILDSRRNGGAPGIWLVIPAVAIGLLAGAEVLTLLRAAGHRPLAWTVHLGIATILLAACAPMAWALAGRIYPPECPVGKLGLVLLAAVAAVACAFFGEMRRFQGPNGAIVNLGLSVLAIMYVALPLSFAALLRQFHGNGWGMAALVSVIFVVKWSDSGAYFVGKSWGRRKLSPALSPGKTVAGGVGGLATAMLASWVFFYGIAPWLAGEHTRGPWWGTLLYGGLLGGVGLFGDLSESLIKRDVQRKDSSVWLPGLGGVLDILDSLLFAFPTGYACFALGIVGPA